MLASKNREVFRKLPFLRAHLNIYVTEPESWKESESRLYLKFQSGVRNNGVRDSVVQLYFHKDKTQKTRKTFLGICQICSLECRMYDCRRALFAVYISRDHMAVLQRTSVSAHAPYSHHIWKSSEAR